MASAPDRIRQPLLKTKLSAPQLRESRVSRPRLLTMLAENASRFLVPVGAPARNGKTTLLAKWIASFSNRNGSGSQVVPFSF